jgi:hypothetical protein
MRSLPVQLLGALLAGTVLIAQGAGWIDKPFSQWTDADAHKILESSPWARPNAATITRRLTEDQLRDGGQMGQPRGVGYDGVDPAGSGPKLSGNIFIGPGGDDRSVRSLPRPLKVMVIWEGALPVRLAKAKLRAPEFSSLDGEGYRIAVYGIPDGDYRGDPKTLGKPLRDLAVLRRQSQKDVKATAVEVYKMEDGPVVLYLFPPSAEIGRSDGQVRFEAQIGRVVVSQIFNLEEMKFQGKLEL